MKLLIVTQNYLPFIGGIEMHARQVAHELSREHQVRIAAGNFLPCKSSPRLRVLHTSLMAPAYNDYEDGPISVHALTPRPADRLRMLPVAVRCLPVLRDRSYDRLLRFGYRRYRAVYVSRLRRLMQGIDIVHSLAGGYIGWAAQEAARQVGLPFACTPFVHPKQWGDGPDDIAYYRRSDAVIGLVATDRDYLVSLGVPTEKTHVIGVSPDMPRATDGDGFRQRHGLEGTPIVLYVGRMMAHKGAEGLLAAATRVWEKWPATRFLFIGPGSAESSVWFKEADPRVQYLGKVSLQEKADALAACDIFCMPSLSEILPTVYLEAWSLGKPVVGGMAHGLPELVEGNGAGLTVSQEPECIAAALIRLLSDPALRECYGARGRELVQQRYSVPAVTDALLALYRSLQHDS